MFVMPDLVSRLDKLIALVPGLKLRELDRWSELSPGLAQKILAGENGDPKLSTLAAYARTFGTTAGFLASGAGRAPTPAAVRRAVSDAEARFVAKANGLSGPRTARSSHPKTVRVRRRTASRTAAQ